MNRLKKITVWLLATSLVLAGAAMLIPKKAVASLAAQVFVTNSTVPVSGNVAITGTTTVQLPPGSTIGVHNIISTPLFTRPSQRPIPFQITLCSASTFGSCQLPGTYGVDPSQQLVIEYVSLVCQSFSGGTIDVAQISTTVGGGDLAEYNFFPSQVNSFSPTEFTKSLVNQPVRIYADPGSTVYLTVSQASLVEVGLTRCFATLSGNLETVAP
jgi:hypothetical protein